MIKTIKKFKLPFHNAKGDILNKNNIPKILFNTNTKIDNEIIHNMLKEVCKSYNVHYNTVLNYIKEFELKYSKHFLCE